MSDISNVTTDGLREEQGFVLKKKIQDCKDRMNIYIYARSLISELTETNPIVSATSGKWFLQLESKPLRRKATSCSVCVHTPLVSISCCNIKQTANQSNHWSNIHPPCCSKDNLKQMWFLSLTHTHLKAPNWSTISGLATRLLKTIGSSSGMVSGGGGAADGDGG